MRNQYEAGAIRWKRWTKNSDPRGYRPPLGWEATLDILNFHPITGKEFSRNHSEQWWIREVFTGATA